MYHDEIKYRCIQINWYTNTSRLIEEWTDALQKNREELTFASKLTNKLNDKQIHQRQTDEQMDRLPDNSRWSNKSMGSNLQGVPQNSLHFSMSKSNFSAHDALRIFILDSPFRRLFKIVQDFKDWAIFNQVMKEILTTQIQTKFMFNWSIFLEFTFYNFHNLWLMNTESNLFYEHNLISSTIE